MATGVSQSGETKPPVRAGLTRRNERDEPMAKCIVCGAAALDDDVPYCCQQHQREALCHASFDFGGQRVIVAQVEAPGKITVTVTDWDYESCRLILDCQQAERFAERIILAAQAARARLNKQEP